jgi:uncharacterized protein involved in response to NO
VDSVKALLQTRTAAVVLAVLFVLLAIGSYLTHDTTTALFLLAAGAASAWRAAAWHRLHKPGAEE